MNELAFALWFFLPAGVANAAPVIANKIPLFNRWTTPLDFGRKYHGQPIFGQNKTWRGLLFGAIIASLVAYLQFMIYQPAALTGKSGGFIAILGALLGIGALLGDAIESFCKRRVNVKPGHSWFPFDQIDYIIGGLVMSLLVIRLRAIDYLVILLAYFGLHLLVAYLGFLFKLKDRPI